jgi:hypothetical protein
MCCGNKRTEFLQTSQPERITLIDFQYIGATSLTVLGRETRNRYHFDRPGAVVAVDARDQLSMAYVPNLRLVIKK